MTSKHIDSPEAFASAFAVSRETVEALSLYADLLRQWGRVQDLVAPSTLDDIWHRHIADSAQVFPLGNGAKTWADLGTGAGFPGLVIAILGRDIPGFQVHLYESSNRKCSFLREVARRTGAPVDIQCIRIEQLATQRTVVPVEFVTARALAPLASLLGLARPLLRDTTRALFLKGREAGNEIAEARKVWSFQSDMAVSRTDPDGRIVSITHLQSLEDESRDSDQSGTESGTGE
jgi:16S rRNA (guanine527-N7)-methyltransferase